MKGTPEYLVRFLRSWLSERSLLVGDELTERPVTCGVPQGSVLGPTLWNIAYDNLLSLAVPPGVQLVGFADDLAVVGRAATSRLLEGRINKVLVDIDNWMTRHGLELAHQKSEALMLTKRLAYTRPRLSIGGHAIAIKQDIRYLVVRLDTKLTFASHVRNVAEKAIKSATALSRLMPNLGGLGQWRRRLLASVVESQLLYAAPVWGNRVRASARTVTHLVRAQRLIALRVIRAYRTVSDKAALLLAGMLPADLFALERGRLKKRFGSTPLPGQAPISKDSIRRSERSTTLDLWQRRWLFSNKGLWTKRLIPDVRKWVSRRLPRVPLTYRMTQFLTGHGCFQYYLNPMGRAASSLCVQCGNAVDSVEHTIIVCPYWENYRAELAERLGDRISTLPYLRSCAVQPKRIFRTFQSRGK
ncbi:Retrovirus-related Pol polyprotein from type-1 retrotransposable element R1 [Aphis craccivora]|uniref:Retrovirus-related Pol polyprotein from type-1 retrotransposable element R1 n=1 Tax=Aphis craccivora TaxID=307492 RepID=A0A6G0VNV3_APHCR|nr:Retrovirus-related Pol polyprotein from type-1 retrotransposable element R1 [Aphis craccivora]